MEETINVPYKEKKAEAAERMRMMKICGTIIRDMRGGKIQFYAGPLGGGYHLTPQMQEAVKEFEQDGKRLVWGVILTKTTDGEEYWSMLYVSDHKEEWAQDRRDLAEGCPIAYVYNANCPEFSELGSIGVKKNIGGTLSRVA